MLFRPICCDPLLPPGLELDTEGDLGFVAIAIVRTCGMRPRSWPPLSPATMYLSVTAFLCAINQIRGGVCAD